MCVLPLVDSVVYFMIFKSVNFTKKTLDLISCFAGVHPVIVNVNRLGKEVDHRLVLLHAHPTRYASRISAFIPVRKNNKQSTVKRIDLQTPETFLHFYFAGLLVIAERAVELTVQRHNGSAFWRRLVLGFATTHGGIGLPFCRRKRSCRRNTPSLFWFFTRVTIN